MKRIHSKEGGIVTVMCQDGGHVECKKTITMSNGDPTLNLKIRDLNLTPSFVKNPPNFMTLINQDVLESVPQNPIPQSLKRALVRGGQLLTDHSEENLDKMLQTTCTL